ncbi:MAG: hypothetical protein KKF46_00650 [Nanoarchaeota archaeon]|nr:hypothetical protein [Nanoarchaeota archaeon]MBU1320844.1 hypothetical protein [Nanoarchaeota archaeon]MBU1597928.1 hypothetical protein [Nanoarchaeota archaeon]MBU2440934.1 hypothetical protein [Nanoarchaeota archaeon]
MNKKILLLGVAVLGILFCASMVSANNQYYGWRYAHQYNNNAYPINPSISGRAYASMPAFEGGFFGNSAAFLTNLRAPIFTGPIWTTRTRQNLASQYYPQARTGGWFGYTGQPGNYYNLRPGTIAYNGVGTGYSESIHKNQLQAPRYRVV